MKEYIFHLIYISNNIESNFTKFSPGIELIKYLESIKILGVYLRIYLIEKNIFNKKFVNCPMMIYINYSKILICNDIFKCVR